MLECDDNRSQSCPLPRGCCSWLPSRRRELEAPRELVEDVWGEVRWVAMAVVEVDAFGFWPGANDECFDEPDICLLMTGCCFACDFLPRIRVERSGVDAVPVVRKMDRRFGNAWASSALISAVSR